MPCEIMSILGLTGLMVQGRLAGQKLRPGAVDGIYVLVGTY